MNAQAAQLAEHGEHNPELLRKKPSIHALQMLDDESQIRQELGQITQLVFTTLSK
jgi:hypothetical protein